MTIGRTGSIRLLDQLVSIHHARVIFDPNKEVSPLYQTQAVVTRGGLVHYGLLVYESPESTLVQTGPDTTVRVAGDDLESMQPSRVSLMPAGLLNDLTDRELADLYAYLRTLRAE